MSTSSTRPRRRKRSDAAAPAPQVTERQIAHSVDPRLWRQVRQWLLDAGWDPDPQIGPDEQFLGYALRLRHLQLGFTLSQRTGTPSAVVSAVLCRGMDRPELGLAAADAANRELRFGQLMFLPGPPPELHFYASWPLDLLDGPLLGAVLRQVVRELEETGFGAVVAVQGMHPADLWQLFDELAEALGAADRDPEAAPDPASTPEAGAEEAHEPPAEAATPQDHAAPRRRRKKPGRSG